MHIQAALTAQGCHAGSKPYHCHRSPSEMVPTQDGRNRLRCDLGSRSQECNPGSNVQNYQQQFKLQKQVSEFCIEPSTWHISTPTKPFVPNCINLFTNTHSCNKWTISRYNSDVELYNEKVERYITALNEYVEGLNNYVQCMYRALE